MVGLGFVKDLETIFTAFIMILAVILPIFVIFRYLHVYKYYIPCMCLLYEFATVTDQ